MGTLSRKPWAKRGSGRGWRKCRRGMSAAARKEPEEEDASTLRLGPVFNERKDNIPLALFNSEVKLLLESRLTQDEHKANHPVQLKALDYVNRFGRHKSKQAVESIRE